MTNLFGTDGIRNKVGQFPFTVQDLSKLARSIYIWANQKYGTDINILMAQDTRQSGDWVKTCLKTGLLLNNVKIDDAGILPTPVLYYYLKDSQKYQFAIAITASHNPFHDNGIKLIPRDSKLNLEDELEITKIFLDLANYTVSFADFGSDHKINLEQFYINKIISLFKPNYLKNIKIVVDLANGAAFRVAPEIFKALGAELIIINNMPDGQNINQNCGAVYLKQLQSNVLEHSANIGFAFDGDGDRVMVVNYNGEIKDGDDVLAMLSTHPEYKDINGAVSTIMANQALANFFQAKKFVRTSVGDKYVLAEMEKNNYILGGEPSGHIILNNIINTGDGILVALKILEAIIYTNNWQFNSIKKYPQITINLPVKYKKDLSQEPLSNLIMSAQNKIGLGRLLVRYSGTENLLRIMAEGEDLDIINNIANNLSLELKELLV